MFVTYGALALAKQPYAPWLLYDHEKQLLDEISSMRHLALTFNALAFTI